MGVGHILVNIDKKQLIDFYRVDTGTKLRELSGNTVASTIVTYYLISNIGDQISFINDVESSFIICGKKYQVDFFTNFQNVTEIIIEELIEQGIIQDEGSLWIDKEENLYYRDLKNIWNSNVKD
ncbi:hypothetical protein [Flectobacillus roseus]|uniref:Uncharacterized protein n=1 Tax=Flectobacillus roseus TaxID=502259 RepID=A0ABT6YGP7_9BACT|nr:hypothetical protein [Flectobacillus roseus]MDI9862273.1 hypothetical protein [Flectobacillus roseus]